MKNEIGIIRMKKSCIYCLVIVLILVALTGCSKFLKGKYDPDLSIGEQIKTRHYYGHASDFGKNQLLNEMLECIKDKDVDRMMNLFSDYALEENDDLKEELKHLYESFPEINEVKNNCSSVSGGHNRGSTEYEYEYQVMADIYDTKGNKYDFICVWIEGYSENPDMQGLHSIQLISKEMYDKHKFRVHSRDDKPGVYAYI